jgi:hypothetical protein
MQPMFSVNTHELWCREGNAPWKLMNEEAMVALLQRNVSIHM